MENQHRKIKGYRELTQTEIDLMNRVKSIGVEIDAVVKDVKSHILDQAAELHGLDPALDSTQDEWQRVSSAEPMRWADDGKTELQKGLMSLTRSIAQPTFF